MVDADKLGRTLRIASKDGIGSENGCPHGGWGALGTQLFDGTGFHITLVISLSKLDYLYMVLVSWASCTCDNNAARPDVLDQPDGKANFL